MKMFAWLRSRYMAIIFFIALFLVFDIGVLVLDFYITEEIKHDAAAVNMAGRQRMLSQRISKVLLQMQNDVVVQTDPQTDQRRALSELKETVDLFDSVLNGFNEGGQVMGGTNQPVLLYRVDTLEGREILKEAYQVWNPLNALLIPILNSTTTIHYDDLLEVNHYAQKNNLKLLDIMNDLTSEREAATATKVLHMRLVQLLAVGLAFVNFGLILFYFIKKLRQSDGQMKQFSNNLVHTNNELQATRDQLLEAKGQTDEILGTVGEGLFLINEEGYIGVEYSKQMEHIFPGQSLGGMKFLDLMKSLLSEKNWGLTQDYQKLLFQKRLKERMLLNVNPLDEIEVVLDSEDEQSVTKTLSFRFNRVLAQDKSIHHVLVTVQDVTESVILAKRLDEQKERAKQQIEMMFSIIQVEPESLHNFLSESDERLETVNDSLKSAQEGKANLQAVVEQIFQKIHSLKGDAALLGLDLFEQAGHRIEDELTQLRERQSLAGEHFVKLTLGLDEIRGYLADTLTLLERLSSYRRSYDRLIKDSESATLTEKTQMLSGSFLHDVITMSGKIAREQGCEVAIDSTHFNADLIPDQHLMKIKDLLIQLVRNAIVHGIETPDERQKKLKPVTGVLRLATEIHADNVVELIVRDDGRGIDLEAIRSRAKANGFTSQEQLDAMDNNALAALIFEPGFSTANEVGMRAGRGVGMNVVKEKVREMGGQLRLAYSPNRFSEFRISLPVMTV